MPRTAWECTNCHKQSLGNGKKYGPSAQASAKCALSGRTPRRRKSSSKRRSPSKSPAALQPCMKIINAGGEDVIGQLSIFRGGLAGFGLLGVRLSSATACVTGGRSGHGAHTHYLALVGTQTDVHSNQFKIPPRCDVFLFPSNSWPRAARIRRNFRLLQVRSISRWSFHIG